MKNIITMLLLAVATLTSCELDKSEELTITPQPEVENFDDVYALGWTPLDGQTACLTLNFDVSESDATRSSGTAMERNIVDVNLYFFNDQMDIAQHIFLRSSSSLTLPVTPGEWSIYAIANSGSDMGTKSHDDIKSYKYEIVNESDLVFNSALIMSFSEVAEISDLHSLDILFTRAVARMDICIDLTSTALSKVALSRMRMVNMPKRLALFGNGSAPASSDLMTYDYRDCGNGSTFSIYMLENLSGTNMAITSESQKTATNAPSTAAYIEIEGTTSDSWVTYRVYLGENNTDDFNVRRNNAFDMDISIYSADASDFRTTIKPFPIDVYISVSSGSVHTIYYKLASAWFPSHLEATINVSVVLDKAVNYDIDVNFEMQWDAGEIYGGFTALLTGYDKETVINIPAGKTSGSVTLLNTDRGPTHTIVTGVTKLNSADENNYYPSTTLFECESSFVFENY
ncbi:MAG: DUF4906 domain-containing protein [Rikenellaceae bacterium]